MSVVVICGDDRNAMKRGFTLIELLVVLGIIAIVSAILFPVFAQARNAAKQANCISNMRQIGVASQIYASDHDETWAPSVNWLPEPGFAPQQVWVGYDNNNQGILGGFWGRVNEPARNQKRPGAIDNYLQSDQIKRCPMMPRTWQMAYCLNWFNPLYGSPYYSTNPAAQGNEFGPGSKTCSIAPDGTFTCTAAANHEIQNPSQTLVAWEHDARVPMCNFLQGYDWFLQAPAVQDLRSHFHFLHRDAAIVLWADTHVKRIPFGNLTRPMFSCRKDIYPDGWE